MNSHQPYTGRKCVVEAVTLMSLVSSQAAGRPIYRAVSFLCFYIGHLFLFISFFSLLLMDDISGAVQVLSSLHLWGAARAELNDKLWKVNVTCRFYSSCFVTRHSRYQWISLKAAAIQRLVTLAAILFPSLEVWLLMNGSTESSVAQALEDCNRNQ